MDWWLVLWGVMWFWVGCAVGTFTYGHRLHPPEEDFYRDGVEAYRAYLRHPKHVNRCACRLYGMPEGAGVIRDNEGWHDTDRCQPNREHLE